MRAGGCVIEVADDGVGFDRHDVPDERLGLRVSIEERIANAGGAAEIGSQPGHGTTVTVAWPAAAAGGDRMIAVPRWLLLVLGALFSAYHVVLGIYTLDVPALAVADRGRAGALHGGHDREPVARASACACPTGSPRSTSP